MLQVNLLIVVSVEFVCCFGQCSGFITEKCATNGENVWPLLWVCGENVPF